MSRILPVLTSLEHDLKLRTVLSPPEEVFRDCPPLLSPLYRLAEPPDEVKNSSTEDFRSSVSEMRYVRTCLWLVSWLRILSAAYKPLLLSEKRDSNNENMASNKRLTTQI